MYLISFTHMTFLLCLIRGKVIALPSICVIEYVIHLPLHYILGFRKYALRKILLQTALSTKKKFSFFLVSWQFMLRQRGENTFMRGAICLKKN